MQTQLKQEPLEPIFTEEMLESLQQRNQKRLEDAKMKMQEKWLLHPSNQVQRKTAGNSK